MLALAASTLEFFVFHILIRSVDRISRLPRSGVEPDVMRILRENLALKAQIKALQIELRTAMSTKRRVPLRTRAAAVYAFLLTRGDASFHKCFLVASRASIARWATALRRGPWPWRRKDPGGRPPLEPRIRELIIQFKSENPLWGAKRIQDELRRLGIKVSQPAIQKVLREAGFFPPKGHPVNLERFRSTAKDLMWAIDFFLVRTAKGVWLNVFLAVDAYTREIIELRAAEVWGPTSAWTIRTLADAMHQEGRQPQIIVNDHGTQFVGQFERQLRVIDVEQRRTPVGLPFFNAICERTVETVRGELLHHVRVRDGEELQWYLDEFKTYFNNHRASQAIGGRTPADFARGSPETEVVDLAAVRARRVVRRSFAHGVLNAYELEDDERIAA